MNQETIHTLCTINSLFYETNAASFSATRGAPWIGWKKCASLFAEHFKHDRSHHWQASNTAPKSFNVLDLACGNLRFEEFLSAQFPETPFSFYAVDNCEGLLPPSQTVFFQNLNIVDALVDSGTPLSSHINTPLCELSVSFGFMHHIPTQKLRLETIQALIDKTRPKGLIAISFWEFLNNAGLAKKAERTHAEALAFFEQGQHFPEINQNISLDPSQLELGDYFLGWKDTPGQYRYCHNFSESEIDELANAVEGSAQTIARFVTDGRTENLNSYLVLQKR